MVYIYLLAHEHSDECLKNHPCKRCRYLNKRDSAFPCKACGVTACFFDISIPADKELKRARQAVA